MIIIINREVRNRGRPGIDFVEENLVEEAIGRVRVNTRAFCRLVLGQRPGWRRIIAEKGSLQKMVIERLAIGLIIGSNEVNRSGVILGSTCEEFCFKKKCEGREEVEKEYKYVSWCRGGKWVCSLGWGPVICGGKYMERVDCAEKNG